MTDVTALFRSFGLWFGVWLAMGVAPLAAWAQARVDPYSGDYIAAVVNSDLVTAVEIDQRVSRAEAAAQRAGQRLPSMEQLRAEVLAALIERCTALGYRQMIAVIGDSGHIASIALHASLGFVRVGTLRSSGIKFGRWVDTVIMQRALGAGDGTLPAGDPAT